MDCEECLFRVEYLEDIVNLLEVNKLLPPKVIERSKNRIEIKRIKKQLELNKNDPQLQEQLNDCLDKEIKFQKHFKKTSFLRTFLDKIHR